MPLPNWHRYEGYYGITSRLDPFEDVTNLIRTLQSREYLVSVIQQSHGLSIREASRRAPAIVAHVRLALEYIDQCYGGPLPVRFLPAYYAILNLLKVYILLGTHHSDLPRHRWHGATYNVHTKGSQSLATEEIAVKSNGAIPLWYTTVTGRSLAARRVCVGELLSFIADVGAEYHLLTGKLPALAGISVFSEGAGKNQRAKLGVHPLSPGTVPKPMLRIMRPGWRARPSERNAFVSPPTSGTDWQTGARRHLNSYLVYYPVRGVVSTPVCSWRMHVPEELPIVLLFFYMSSVCRYKPEFLDKLEDSKYWPLLSSSLRHSMLKMLILTWSFVHQKTLLLQGE